jgi:hypothetical protein
MLLQHGASDIGRIYNDPTGKSFQFVCDRAMALPNSSSLRPEVRENLAREPPERGGRFPPPQQPLQMLLSILLSCCWIARSSGVGPADCEAPGRGTVSPVDVR